MAPINPWRPASMITMNPTTTPGNASGNVSSATSNRLAGNSRRARNKPAIVDNPSVAAVTASDNAIVASKLCRYRALVRTSRYAVNASGTALACSNATSGSNQNAQNTASAGASRKTRARVEKVESCIVERSVHDAQILFAERALLGGHLREVDVLGARILRRRQELRSYVRRQRSAAHRSQIRVRPQALAFIRQHEIQHFLAVRLMRCALHEAHHIRHDDRAFLRNHELHVRVILVFRTIRVEVIVEQDRNLAGHHPDR